MGLLETAHVYVTQELFLLIIGRPDTEIKTNNACKVLRSVPGIQEALEMLINDIPPYVYSLDSMPDTMLKLGILK